MKHRQKPHNIGEKNPRAKLTAEKVVWIRRMAGAGFDYMEIAAMVGVDWATARRAAIGISWKNVPEPMKLRPTICCNGVAHKSLTSEVGCLKRALIATRRERDELASRLLVVSGE